MQNRKICKNIIIKTYHIFEEEKVQITIYMIIYLYTKQTRLHIMYNLRKIFKNMGNVALELKNMEFFLDNFHIKFFKGKLKIWEKFSYFIIFKKYHITQQIPFFTIHFFSTFTYHPDTYSPLNYHISLSLSDPLMLSLS